MQDYRSRECLQASEEGLLHPGLKVYTDIVPYYIAEIYGIVAESPAYLIYGALKGFGFFAPLSVRIEYGQLLALVFVNQVDCGHREHAYGGVGAFIFFYYFVGGFSDFLGEIACGRKLDLSGNGVE